jgi:signal peptidase I
MRSSAAALVLLALLVLPPAARAACASTTFHVSGRSLAPFVKDGATLPGRVGRDCADPGRGELLLFTRPGLKIPLLKIVIGVPGDRFGVRRAGNAWNILVNGTVATNPEGMPYRLNKSRADEIGLYAKGAGGVIPPNAWLVMGDQTGGTDDSSRFGLITRPALRGMAVPPHSRK